MLSASRRRLAAVTVGLLLVIALLIVAASRTSPSAYLSARAIAAGSAPVGKTVTVGGSVVSSSAGVLVLAPEDSETPTISVTMADASMDSTFGRGVIVIVEGRVTGPGEVEDAVMIAPTGPSKYVRPESDRIAR